MTPVMYVVLSGYQRRMLGVENLACEGREAMSVYVAKPTKRWKFLWLLARAIVRAPRPAELDVMCVTDMTVAIHRRHVRVVVDGEVRDMRTPLHYRLIPAGLRMVLPGKSVDSSQ